MVDNLSIGLLERNLNKKHSPPQYAKVTDVMSFSISSLSCTKAQTKTRISFTEFLNIKFYKSHSGRGKH